MHEEPDIGSTLPDAMRALQVLANESGNSWTVLHAAAAAGHVEATRFLLASGMPVDATDADGDTALHVCAQAGHGSVARVLIDASASTTIVGAFGHTPGRRAELMGHHALAELLRAAPGTAGSKRNRLLHRLRQLWPF